MLVLSEVGGPEGRRGSGCRKWREEEEKKVALKDKNDGKETETDNGVQLLFPLLSLALDARQTAQRCSWMQVTAAFQPQTCIGLFFVPSLSSCWVTAEAAHSLALSQKPIVTSTLPHAWEASVAAKHNRALCLSFTQAQVKRGGEGGWWFLTPHTQGTGLCGHVFHFSAVMCVA